MIETSKFNIQTHYIFSILLMILITFTQVIFRYILNSALPWAVKLQYSFYLGNFFGCSHNIAQRLAYRSRYNNYN